MGSSSGSYKTGVGSLSSSSNLSPLAPPFMVDKSFPRSNSINPSVNFPELPVYGTVFDPAGPFSSSGHKFGATEPLGSSSCPPSGAIYGYPGSGSNNSDVYYVGQNAGTGYDPFSYDQFPNNVSDHDGDHGVKPYYGPYVSSPSPCKDAYVGPSYDLLSSSSGGHFTGYDAPDLDHTQGASSVAEYKPKWTGFWGGLGNSEHEKWTEYAPGSGLKDFKLADMSSNQSHLSVDRTNQSHLFTGTTNHSLSPCDTGGNTHLFGDKSNSDLKQGACVSQGIDCHGAGSTFSGNCFDIFGGTYNFGIQQGQNSSFKLSGGSSSDCSKVPSFPGAAFIDSPGLQRPLLESVPNSDVSQKAIGSSSKDPFSQTGCYVFGGSTSSVGSTFSGIQVNSMSVTTACSTNPSAGNLQDSGYPKELKIPLNREFSSGVVIKRPSSFSKFGLSSQKGDTLSDGLDVKFTTDKAKFTPQGSSQFGPNVASLKADDAEAYGFGVKFTTDKANFTTQVSSQFGSNGFSPNGSDVEASCSLDKNSSGSDLHNPAEDSPCWKGASSSRFSPFSVSEAVATEVLVNQEDGCKSPEAKEPQKKSPPVDVSDNVDFSSEKVNVSTFPEKPAVFSGTTEDHEGFNSGNQKSYCIDLNMPDGLEFFDECCVSGKDPSMSNKQRSGLDSKLSSSAGLVHKKAEFTSSLNISKASVGAHTSSGVTSNDGNNSSSSTGEKASLKCNKSMKKSLESRFDVNLVLKTMMKLSQMLRCHCLGNPAALTEQHSQTLEQIISNLNASSSLAQTMRPITILSKQDGHFLKELPVSEMVNKQGRTAEDFLDSSEDDMDALCDDNVTQAIKKILYDTLHEAIDHPELLYRNLWLEAEAALCVMTAKTRFHRMKIEMEKSSQDRTQDDENPPNPEMSSDGHHSIELAPPVLSCDHESQKKSNTEKIPESNSQQPILNSMEASRSTESRIDPAFPPFSYDSSPFKSGNDSSGLGGAANFANGVENCVMTRYQILKSRDDDSGTLSYNGGQSSEDLFSQDTTGVVGTPFSGTTCYAHDVETPPVIARYQILKSRSQNSQSNDDTEALNDLEGGQSLREEKNYYLSNMDMSGNKGANVQGKDGETSSIMARYQILKSQMENFSALNEGGKQSSGGENYPIGGGDSSSPWKQFMNPVLFNSVGSEASADEVHASVMARFRVIQNRLNGLNLVNMEPTPTQGNNSPAEDASEEKGWAQQQERSFVTNLFGPYPDISEVEDVKKLCVSDGKTPITQSMESELMTEILEGWYDNGSPTSDWEHVSKEELRKQN